MYELYLFKIYLFEKNCKNTAINYFNATGNVKYYWLPPSPLCERKQQQIRDK